MQKKKQDFREDKIQFVRDKIHINKYHSSA